MDQVVKSNVLIRKKITKQASEMRNMPIDMKAPDSKVGSQVGSRAPNKLFKTLNFTNVNLNRSPRNIREARGAMEHKI